MLRNKWLRKFTSPGQKGRVQRSPARRTVLPRLESLEERLAPAVFDVSNATQLQQAINAVNAPASDATNTIVLSAGTYNLSSQLTVTTPHTLVIQGATGKAGDVVLDAAGANNRAFLLTGPTNVTFQSLTLQHGTAHDNGVTTNTEARGGAILDLGGNVTLSNAVVQNNKAVGNAGKDGEGGGVFVSGGQLTVVNGTVISNNQALGGNGVAGGAAAGFGEGGGVLITAASNSITLDASSITGNKAIGGSGANGNKTSIAGQIGGGRRAAACTSAAPPCS